MLVYNTLDTDEVGPNYVRLRNRFEVTNGVHESTDNNILMRTMSYAMFLGDTKEVKNLII